MKIIGMTAMVALLGTSTVFASESAIPHKHIEGLIQQNKKLTERVHKLEKHLERGNPSQTTETEKKTTPSYIKAVTDNVEISGLVEAELGVVQDDIAGEDSSDITLATVEVHLDAQASDWSSAHVLFLYEGGAEDEHLMVDEGTITIGNPEKLPVYLTAGKMYVPFGSFETNMIADPLTLEIGETGDSAMQIGVESNGFYGSVYTFNGDINEVGDDDEINTFGFNLAYAMENSKMGLNVGMDWLSNIGDTDGIEGALPAEIDEYVSGITLHGLFTMGPVNIIGEYVMALDNFTAAELAFNGAGAEPSAWNIEAGYTMELMGNETTFALGLQGSDEALALELPENRYVASVGMALFDHTSLGIEYCLDEDYEVNDGGTGEEATTFTVQLGVEF